MMSQAMRLAIPSLVVMLACVAQEPTIRTNVPLVIVPTTVTDHSGKYIDGLGGGDFILLDNGTPVKFALDTSDTTLVPISIVIAVQANGGAAPVIAKLHKVGSMIQPLITGERGEASVVLFDEEVRLLQEFTSDPFKISDAFASIRPRRSGDAHLIDAVSESIHMLAARPANRRKIILLISESRDRGSKDKLDAVLESAERENIVVYPASYSAYSTAFTQKGSEVPPAQSAGDLLAIFHEIGRNAKANAAEELAKYTGGRHLSFTRLKGLENTIANVGEELHSQYLLSFTPSANDGEFHRLEVKLVDRADAQVRTRPGYWASAP